MPDPATPPVIRSILPTGTFCLIISIAASYFACLIPSLIPCFFKIISNFIYYPFRYIWKALFPSITLSYPWHVRPRPSLWQYKQHHLFLEHRPKKQRYSLHCTSSCTTNTWTWPSGSMPTCLKRYSSASKPPKVIRLPIPLCPFLCTWHSRSIP